MQPVKLSEPLYAPLRYLRLAVDPLLAPASDATSKPLPPAPAIATVPPLEHSFEVERKALHTIEEYMTAANVRAVALEAAAEERAHRKAAAAVAAEADAAAAAAAAAAVTPAASPATSGREGFHSHDPLPPATAERRRSAVSVMPEQPRAGAAASPQPIHAPEWECGACTMRCPESAAHCDMCGTPRKGGARSPAPSPAPAPAPAAAPTVWACGTCTAENAARYSTCQLCGEPRRNAGGASRPGTGV